MTSSRRPQRPALTLRATLVLLLLGLMAAALAVAGAVTTGQLHGYLVNRVDDQLANAAGPFLRGPGDFGDPDGDHGGTGGGTPPVHRLPSEYYVATFTGSGTRSATLDQLPSSQSPPHLPSLTPAQAAAHGTTPFTVRSEDGHESWRVLTATLPGGGTVAVAASLGDVDRTVSRLVTLEALIGLGVLVLLGVAGSLLVRRSLRPLADVEATAGAIAAGDLAHRVSTTDPRTEVGRLGIAFNAMLARIEQAFRQQRASEREARESEGRMRQFVADASHELRTPLTSIRGFAELYRLGAAEDAEELPRLMRRIEDEAARMGVLVEDLLLLARLDQQRPVERAPVDVLAVANDVTHDARAVAPGRDVTLDVDLSAGPAVVLGDDARLRQVLHNLVTNALVHAPSSAVVVRIATRADATGDAGAGVVRLSVVDHGPGLTAEQAARVFERFYRADTSRARDAGGSGLGMSIVAGLVAAHGGRVDVEETPGGGATFVVTLPRAVA